MMKLLLPNKPPIELPRSITKRPVPPRRPSTDGVFATDIVEAEVIRNGKPLK